jgi:hypothetical protein
MKNNRNIFVKTLCTLAIIFAITCTTSLSAQVPTQGPPELTLDDDTGSGDSIPLDGGLAILLVGAAAFGIKKLRGAKKEKL